MIVANLVSCVFNVINNKMAFWIYASDAKAQEFFYVNHSAADYFSYAMIVMGCLSLVNVIGASFILKWKKLGYWFFVASAVIVFSIMCSFAVSGGWTSAVIRSMFGAIAGPAILYAILCIKKNGISCWRQLE